MERDVFFLSRTCVTGIPGNILLQFCGVVHVEISSVKL